MLRLSQLGSLFLALSLASSAANSQVWDARKMLATQGTTGFVSLKYEGKEVAQVDRARVARFVEVVDKVDSRYGFSPQVVLIPGKAPNAFATRTKDGKPVVGVNAAMLEVAGNDPDMTAVVVGHELAHLQLKHLEEGKAREAAVNIIALIAGAAVGYNATRRGVDGRPFLELAGLGGLLANRKFDRDQEREADELGLKAIHEAGYDAHAAPRLWTAMQRFGGGSGLWISTHPSNDERIESLTKLAGEMRRSDSVPTMAASVAPSAPSTVATSSATNPDYLPRTASTLTAATADSVPRRGGQESYQIERMGQKKNCDPNARAWLTGKDIGFELYTYQCNTEETWSLRCEFGQCRILQ